MTYGFNDHYRQQTGVHPVLDQILNNWSGDQKKNGLRFN